MNDDAVSPCPDAALTSPHHPADRLWRLWRAGGRPDVDSFLAAAGPLPPAEAAAVLRVDQRERWQAGERVPAEAYLRRLPCLRDNPEAAVDLIYGEFLLRERLGERPDVGEYLRRFPEYADVLRPQVDLHRAMAAESDGDGASSPPRPSETATLPTTPLPPQESAAPAVPPALAGHPRYRVLGPLGAGGMGAVFKAEHLLMERTVALKVISHDLIDQPGAVERFRREVKAAAKLTHPNIVAAYDAEQAGDVHFLVMEYVEGASLARLLEGQGPLPPEKACDYARQAALGLQHAFEKGMVHRDVKPHNLMLTPAGQVKVLDFGLARFAQESRPAGALTQPPAATPPGAPADSLTQAGAVMGTPDYMAPEQIRDAHAADTRADVYSLGCTLYALLAGRPPFPEGTVVQKAAAHLEEAPRPLADLRRGLPPGLAKVVARMMEKDPARRYQTPAAAAAALLPFTGAEVVRRRRSRRRWLVALASLAVVAALAGGAAFWLWPRPAVDDLQRIQGGWKSVSGEYYGRPMSEAELKHFVFAVLFDGDHVVWIAGDGQASTETFRLDPGKNPKEIDIFADEGQVHGIYRLEGDAFTVCMVSNPGMRRPTDFVTDPNGVAALFVFRREPGPLAPPRPPPDDSIRRFVGHTSTVKSVAYSPDGRYALSASGPDPEGPDCSVRLWDLNTGAEVRRYGPHVRPVFGAAFSPDGRLVASASADQTVRLFDRESGEEVKRLATPTQTYVCALAFSHDGERLLSGGGGPGDCQARLWDVAGGKEVQRFEGHTGIINTAALSPDGRFALTGSQDRTARIWDVTDGRELRRLEGHTAPVEGVAFSPDSRYAATCGRDGAVLLWEAETGRQIRSFPGHDGQVLSVAFSPDGTRLLTGGSDGTVRLWKVETGEQAACLRGHSTWVWSVAFSPDGRRALSGSADQTLRLWQLPEPDPKADSP